MNNIGLRVMASGTSFVIEIGALGIEDNEITVTPKALQASYDLVACFSTKTVGIDGTPALSVSCFQEYTTGIEAKLEHFIDTYKAELPQLKAMAKKIKELKIGEYIFVIKSDIPIDTKQTIEIYNELNRLNGNKNDLKVPLLEEYNMYPYGDMSVQIGHGKSSRICRWCGETVNSNPPATFKKKAHAITEAIGNKNLVLLDECDACNEKFGNTIERSIVALFSLYNTFWGVKGKNGVASVVKESTSIDENGEKTKNIVRVEHSNGQINIALSEQYFIMEGEQPVGMKIPITKNFIARDVYKSLCKYALSLVEQEEILPEFIDIIRWIKGYHDEIDDLPIVKVLYSYVFFPEQPILHLYVRKTTNESLPFMFAEFQYKNFIMVYIIPRNKEECMKFTNKDNFNTFWKKTFYSEAPDWEDWNFSCKKPKELCYNIKLERESHNSLAMALLPTA